MHCISDAHSEEIAAVVRDEQRNICKTEDRHITKGKPRAARFAVSTDARCKSPE